MPMIERVFRFATGRRRSFHAACLFPHGITRRINLRCFGLHDMRAEAVAASARRSDTPTQLVLVDEVDVTGARNGLCLSGFANTRGRIHPIPAARQLAL